MGILNNVLNLLTKHGTNKRSHDDIAFEDQVKKDGAEYAGKRIAALVNEKISTKNLARQFVIEELDAARQGDLQAQNFAKGSGFDSSDYIGAMDKTSWVGDESELEHIQLFVRNFVYRIQDKELMAKLLITIVDEIMKKWKLGKYESSNNEETNIEFLMTAAEQGNANAQFNLGAMFAEGNGVSQDYEIAVGWFTKAANNGDAIAQYTLGNLHTTGEYISTDYKKAIEWYEKAANQGHIKAQLELGRGERLFEFWC